MAAEVGQAITWWAIASAFGGTLIGATLGGLTSYFLQTRRKWRSFFHWTVTCLTTWPSLDDLHNSAITNYRLYAEKRGSLLATLQPVQMAGNVGTTFLTKEDRERMKPQR